MLQNVKNKLSDKKINQIKKNIVAMKKNDYFCNLEKHHPILIIK